MALSRRRALAVLAAPVALLLSGPAARAVPQTVSPAAAFAAVRPAAIGPISIEGVASTELHQAVRMHVPTIAGPSDLPIGDLPGWRQIFTDDFTTEIPRGAFPAATVATWGAYPSPWRDTSKHGMYSPTKVVDVTGGVLSEQIRTEDGVPLVAALTPRLPGTAKHGVQYGRFAARVRADPVPGYKLVMMLWPDSGDNRADGEIDFPELNLDSPNMMGFVHHTGATGGSDQAWFRSPTTLSDWHTVVLEWSPNLVVATVDGVEVGRTSGRIPSGPMHWVLQTETALHSPVPPPADAAGAVQFDWVAAWAYDPSIR